MEHCAVFSQRTHTSWITIHDSYFLSGNRQPSHRDTKSKLFLISAVLPADQNECEALSDRVEAALVRWWNYTSQSIPPFFFFFAMHEFQAQCNHSHICCLLRRCGGYYRCSKFPTLLRIFIAFGFTVGRAERRLKHAMGIFHTIKE